jgi:SWI/SNF-related matrix-associated actin-dependent regulator of chromatin subfamily A3
MASTASASRLSAASATTTPAVVSPPPSMSLTQQEEEEESQDNYLGALATDTHNYTKVVGIRHYAGVAHPGEYVRLRREPHNPYDRNAVRVDNMAGLKVGHMARQVAAPLSNFMRTHPDVKVDATILPQARRNGFDLPIEITFYGSADDASLSTTIDQVFAPLRLRNVAAHAGKRVRAATTTSVVQTTSRQVDWQREQKHLDDLFAKQAQAQLANLAPVPPPPALTVTLLAHQVAGLAWLVQREQVQPLDKREIPFYKRVQEKNATVWLCEITNASQPQPPAAVRGGVRRSYEYVLYVLRLSCTEGMTHALRHFSMDTDSRR